MNKPKAWNSLADYVRGKMKLASVRQWIIAVIIIVALYGILAINLTPESYDLEVGEVTRTDIRVPRDMENRAQTQRNRDLAANTAVAAAQEDPANWVINQVPVSKANARLNGVIESFIAAHAEYQNGLSGQDESATSVIGAQLQNELAKEHEVLLANNLVRQVLLIEPNEFDIFIQEIRQSIHTIITGRISADNVAQIKEQYAQVIVKSQLSPALQQVANQVGYQIIEPNLMLDADKIERARDEAIRSVDPIMVKQGEIVVSDGTVVTADHLQLLQDLGLYRKGIDYLSLLGLLLFLITLVGLFSYTMYKLAPNSLVNENRLALLGSVLIIVTLLSKIISFIDWPLAVYLAPIALAGMIITMLLDSRTAVLAVLFLAVINGVIYYSMVPVIVAFLGGLTAIVSVSQVSQRTELMHAGFIVGGINLLAMVAFGLLERDSSLIIHSYLGVLNGVISSIIAIGTLPYFEIVFDITSAVKLLELSNPNHPLLRRLLMETPGTYHHSIIVGNLSEAAADAVGGDGLLARVGSYYHDIGKLKRPYFFAENQLTTENPHDKIAPSLSTLIITAHVKDGVELAREYKLPDVITMFVKQHHGSDLVKFFYHRAKENGGDSVEEQDYRYPGPTPQTKEVAIVSLADATEAAVRSLVKPTPSKIEVMVKKIIHDRMEDGQLDESDLTFKDLDKIAEAFTKVLTGIFHARVEYPENITREDIEGKRRS